MQALIRIATIDEYRLINTAVSQAMNYALPEIQQKYATERYATDEPTPMLVDENGVIYAHLGYDEEGSPIAPLNSESEPIAVEECFFFPFNDVLAQILLSVKGKLVYDGNYNRLFTA